MSNGLNLTSLSWTLVSFIILKGESVVDCTQLLTDHLTNWETSGLCKIMEGLLRMTHNFLLTTHVPKQFDSADFFAHLEVLLIYTSTPTNPELYAIPQRLLGLYLQGPFFFLFFQRSCSPCWREEILWFFFLDFMTDKNSKGTFKLRYK